MEMPRGTRQGTTRSRFVLVFLLPKLSPELNDLSVLRVDGVFDRYLKIRFAIDPAAACTLRPKSCPINVNRFKLSRPPGL